MTNVGTIIMADGVSWLALILIIIVIIILIIIIVIFFNHRNQLIAFGISFNVQNGTTSGSTDTMILEGNQIYLAQSNSPLTLTLNKGNNQQLGRLVAIKNNTGNLVTMQIGTINLNMGQLNTTINQGQLALLLATDDKGSWLRLQ